MQRLLLFYLLVVYSTYVFKNELYLSVTPSNLIFSLLPILIAIVSISHYQEKYFELKHNYEKLSREMTILQNEFESEKESKEEDDEDDEEDEDDDDEIERIEEREESERTESPEEERELKESLVEKEGTLINDSPNSQSPDTVDDSPLNTTQPIDSTYVCTTNCKSDCKICCKIIEKSTGKTDFGGFVFVN